jgi:hypothetical protein
MEKVCDGRWAIVSFAFSLIPLFCSRENSLTLKTEQLEVYAVTFQWMAVFEKCRLELEKCRLEQDLRCIKKRKIF